jgi:hypothetical protein
LGIKGGNWKSPNRLGSENQRGVNGGFSIMFDYRVIRTRKNPWDSLDLSGILSTSNWKTYDGGFMGL